MHWLFVNHLTLQYLIYVISIYKKYKTWILNINKQVNFYNLLYSVITNITNHNQTFSPPTSSSITSSDHLRYQDPARLLLLGRNESPKVLLPVTSLDFLLLAHTRFLVYFELPSSFYTIRALPAPLHGFTSWFL